MIKISRRSILGGVASAAIGLGGCQSILPGDGPSRLAMRQAPVVAASGQRLGPDGYPLLGAFPNSAGPQIDDAAVQTERSQLQTAAAAQNAGSASTATLYQQRLAEMDAIKARQRKESAAQLAASPSPSAKTSGAADGPAAVLRDIEAGR